jgi:hypothetical protein
VICQRALLVLVNLRPSWQEPWMAMLNVVCQKALLVLVNLRPSWQESLLVAMRWGVCLALAPRPSTSALPLAPRKPESTLENPTCDVTAGGQTSRLSFANLETVLFVPGEPAGDADDEVGADTDVDLVVRVALVLRIPVPVATAWPWAGAAGMAAVFVASAWEAAFAQPACVWVVVGLVAARMHFAV